MIFVFAGIKEKNHQRLFNVCLFCYCFGDSFLAKLYVAVLVVYRKNALKYRDMTFSSYRPAPALGVTLLIGVIDIFDAQSK